MKTPNRHSLRLGHMLVVLMFVFTSIVPGSMHAFAMAESQVADSGGHYAMMGQISGDQPMAAYHLSRAVSADLAKEPIPTGTDIGPDRCCPATCFVALCIFDVVAMDRFVPESFEVEPTAEFIVVVMALPERPPRV
ncbi:MAG: hypothetical protein ABJN75_19425 [Hoeflea sp.]|uniref:hypothetical protein n=1 Tax=Hoeflea sp. TaxID=1940281 RepID=UPI003296CAA8